MNADTSNISTAHGLVNRSALEDLQGSFDTLPLLRGVDAVDGLVRDMRSEGGVRDQLLQLHAMASTVLNGAGLAGPSDATLPDAAIDLIERLNEARQVIDMLNLVVAPLARLAPHDVDQ
jgi:hypothetical protein